LKQHFDWGVARAPLATLLAGSCVTLSLRRWDGHRKLVTRFGVIHPSIIKGLVYIYAQAIIVNLFNSDLFFMEMKVNFTVVH